MAGSVIRVLLADDHAMVRAGMRMLLEESGQFLVVGEAASGQQALAEVRAQRPDVILMDLSMPGMDGFAATAEIVRRFERVRVLVVSMHADDAYVTRAFEAGATGFVPKEADGAELVRAIRAVAAGERYVGAEPAGKGSPNGTSGTAAEKYAGLTPRQREILRVVAEGLKTREIADRLGISQKTVEAHRSNIMRKLGVRDVTALVRFAIRAGVVRP